MTRIVDQALDEARIMVEGGLDGLLVENFGDSPFHPGSVPAETIASMTVVARKLVESFPVPVGINVLRNDARGALAVAAASGAGFIRVNVHTGAMFTDQGLLEGKAHETLRGRETLGLPVAILADVFVKHATPPPNATLEEAARDAWHRGHADGLIVTGTGAGVAPGRGEVGRVKKVLPPQAPVWVGSGVTSENAPVLLEEADGMIVGSALQTGGFAGGGVEIGRVRAFMDAVTG
jgi:membrane complex biogenesis BtpA family protein